jgi:superoxide reductase
MPATPILDPIHWTADIETADDFTKKHFPSIEATRREDGKVDVRVSVGTLGVPHPNEPAHWIEWITLSIGEAPVTRFEFAPGIAYPDVTVVLDVPSLESVRALASCNMHGLWAAEVVPPVPLDTSGEGSSAQ